VRRLSSLEKEMAAFMQTAIPEKLPRTKFDAASPRKVDAAKGGRTHFERSGNGVAWRDVQATALSQ